MHDEPDRPDDGVGTAGRATIVDVARHVGVSIATVSRAMNGRPGVAPRTVAKVQQAVRELGFSPAVAAQRLQGQRSRAISLLFPAGTTEVEAYDIDFILGAAAATAERNYFFNVHLERMEPEELLAIFRGGLVDGVVLLQVLLDDWRVDLLAEHDLPFTLAGRTEDDDVASYVDVDFERAVDVAVRHLVDLGHRRIGMIGRPQRQVRTGLGSAVRLMRGFEAACAAHGASGLVAASEFDRTSARQGVERLLDSTPPVTAVIATHGHAVASAYAVIRDRGTDVSVIAIGSERGLEMLEPVPSAVSFPAADLGYRSAAMLIDRIEHEGPELLPLQRVLLPVQLTLRSSTAPPPQDPAP